MDRIKVHDKHFRPFIKHDIIQEKIRDLAQKINAEYRDKELPLFISVLNGSFMFTSDLIKHIDFPCELTFIKISSYSGTSSTGKIKEVLGLGIPVKGRNVIVIEDIVDTGNTIVALHKMLEEEGASDIKICTLLLKPEAYDKNLAIDFAAIEIPNDFVVGYGLDYNELGRQYKNIYTLDV